MQVAASEKDRRQYVRVNPAIGNPVLSNIHFNGREFNNLPVTDISLGGVALKIPNMKLKPMEGTHILDMNFHLPQVGVVVASGIVRRIETEILTNEVSCALEFTKVPTSSDRLLFKYINNRQREMSWFERGN